jgi:hypothetical protein
MFKIPKFKQFSTGKTIDNSMKNMFKTDFSNFPKLDKKSKSKRNTDYDDVRLGSRPNPIVNKDLIDWKESNNIYPFNNYHKKKYKEEYVEEDKNKKNRLYVVGKDKILEHEGYINRNNSKWNLDHSQVDSFSDTLKNDSSALKFRTFEDSDLFGDKALYHTSIAFPGEFYDLAESDKNYLGNFIKGVKYINKKENLRNDMPIKTLGGDTLGYVKDFIVSDNSPNKKHGMTKQQGYFTQMLGKTSGGYLAPKNSGDAMRIGLATAIPGEQYINATDRDYWKQVNQKKQISSEMPETGKPDEIQGRVLEFPEDNRKFEREPKQFKYGDEVVIGRLGRETKRKEYKFIQDPKEIERNRRMLEGNFDDNEIIINPKQKESHIEFFKRMKNIKHDDDSDDNIKDGFTFVGKGYKLFEERTDDKYQHSDFFGPEIRQTYGSKSRWDEPVRMQVLNTTYNRPGTVYISNVTNKEELLDAIQNKNFFNSFQLLKEKGLEEDYPVKGFYDEDDKENHKHLGYVSEFINLDNSKDNKKVIGYADGKPVIKLNKGIYPSVGTLNNIYKKIPDDRKVPVVLETRENYLKEYTQNQEKLKGIKFSQEEKDRYMKEELQKLQPVTARFTTYHNKWIPARVVLFPGKTNKKEVEANVLHEFGHEVEEKNKSLAKDWNKHINKKTSPTLYGTTDKDEDFAESFALYKNHKTITISNPNTSKQEIDKRFNIIHKHLGNSIRQDKSKNSQIYLGKNNTDILSKHGIVAYNYENRPDKIYISNNLKTDDPEIWAQVLGHEELHNELSKSLDNKTSRQLDNISVPVILGIKNDVKYKHSIGKISPEYKRMMLAENNEEIKKHYNNLKEIYPDKDNSTKSMVSDYNLADDTYKQNYLMTEAYTGNKIFGDLDTTDDDKLNDMEILANYRDQNFRQKTALMINDDTFSLANQSLFHAGNIPPSQRVQQEGKVYGFSNLNYAKGWQKKNNLQHIYQFNTTNFDLDNKQYSRSTPMGNKLSDNELIAHNVIDEKDVSQSREQVTIEHCDFCKNNTQHYNHICMECYKVK